MGHEDSLPHSSGLLLDLPLTDIPSTNNTGDQMERQNRHYLLKVTYITILCFVKQNGISVSVQAVTLLSEKLYSSHHIKCLVEVWSTVTHQFDIALCVQKQVFWFQVSVDDASCMKIIKCFNHTCCYKAGCVIIKTPSVPQYRPHLSPQTCLQKHVDILGISKSAV